MRSLHRRYDYCAAVIGMLLLAASGCHRASRAATGANGPAGASSAAAVAERVTAGTPVRQTVKVVTSQPGRIDAFEQTPLYPKLTGYVREILVDIGDAVKRDQPLIRLSVPELLDELAQKKALLAQAEAEIRQSQAAVVAAQAAVKTAQAHTVRAQAGTTRANGEYQRWQAEHARISDLAVGGSITHKLVDETLNQFRASEAAQQEAAAEVAAARTAEDEAHANVEKAKADAGAASARQEVAEADVAHTQTMLAYAEIKAPFDGVVTARYVDTGHYVQSSSAVGAKPLLVVASMDRVRIFIDVPEMESELVNPGDAVLVRVQALRGEEIEGAVTRTSWALEPSNRSLRTEIDLPNDHGRLRPGMYATAEIQLAASKDALTVPATAIVRKGRETHVCSVESGTIACKPVTLGLRQGDRVEILSGLTQDATVVLARADSLLEGQSVEVISTK